MNRPGFTMLELLVAIVIVALLVALALPAVQSARQSARRMECSSNLRQLAIAVGNYEAIHRVLPAGTAFGASWHVAILPQIDQAALFARYDFKNRSDDAVCTESIPLFLCPAESASRFLVVNASRKAATSYVGNSGAGVTRHGYNGIFRPIVSETLGYPTGQIRTADIQNGLSNTAMLSEILHADGSFERLRVNWTTPREYLSGDELDEFANVCGAIPVMPTDFGWRGSPYIRGLPWSQGDQGYTLYNHVLSPNQPSCDNGQNVQLGGYSAASAHPGGVNVAFADGHVQFVSNEVERSIWRSMGSRIFSALPHVE